MKIFITGVLGVIGSELARELRNRGHEVAGCDLYHSHSPDYFRCDIGDYRQLHDTLVETNPDIVYNAAGEFGRRNGEDYYEQLFRTNLTGAKNLISLARKFKFRIVHFSSSEIYGDYDGLLTEDVPDRTVIRPMNDYAGTKIFNEWQLRNGCLAHGVEHVIVRLFNLYGNEPYSPYRSVICRFCFYASTGGKLTVFRGHSRSFLYISDAVHTLANIADRFVGGSIYNIGNSSRFYDIEEVAAMIIRRAGASPDLVEIKGMEPLTARMKRCDTRAAESALGHRITVGIEEGIGLTLSFLKNELKER